MGETLFGWGQRAHQIHMNVAEAFWWNMDRFHRSLHVAMDFCFCTSFAIEEKFFASGPLGRPDEPGLDQLHSCFKTRMGKSMDAIEN
jgi:hypothetical protein